MSYSLKDILKSLKVLFVSKEEEISQRELDILNIFFHKIILTHNAEKALNLFSSQHPDVIITDIELLNSNGIELCKTIRKSNPNIPIIILSKNKSENYLFQVIRLQVIDFVVRPLKSENLIFALNQTAKHIVNHGNITIKLSNDFIYNYKEKHIKRGDSEIEKLTKNEFRLLELLIANKHRTISKEEIIDTLWGNEEITESAFKSLFSRLRHKIGKECIKNSFGIGYQLV